MNHSARTLILAAAMTGMAGCSAPATDSPGDPITANTAPPVTKASITGTVTAVEGTRILVEERPEERGGSLKASVRIEEARILRRSGGPATARDIVVGQLVSVWFTGPVAESYPVQAKAGTIVIEPRPEG
jgi:hypothetical protein